MRRRSLTVARPFASAPLLISSLTLRSSYIAMGQYEKAIRILKMMAEKQPDQTVAHTQLAVAYVFGGRNDDARKEALRPAGLK